VAAVKLTFRRLPVPTPGPVRLVFGDDDAQPAIPDVTLHGGGRITGLRVHIGLRTGVCLVGGGRISGMRLHMAAKYDINVSRPTVGGASTRWQDAAPLSHAARSTWQQSVPLPAGTHSDWRDAAALAASLQVRWEDSQQLQRAVCIAFEQAAQLPTAPTHSGFQEAERVQTSAATGFQEAIRLLVAPLRVRFEETLRDRQVRAGARFEVADMLAAAVASGMGIAVRLPRSWGGRFQQSWTPRPGQWQRPVPPKPGEPCYEPALPAHLVFADPFDANLPARLVFVCERHGPDPEPKPPQYVIPLLKVYMAVHALTAELLPGREPVVLRDVSIASDDDGYGWSFSGTGPEHLLDQLAPLSGLPRQIRVTLDGISWVFAVQSLSRSRRFGEHRVAVQGASVTALLGDPYMPEQTWLDANGATAQQLVAQALQFTGVGIQWGITDWYVPPGVWSFQGTPLAAALRVAEAAGAVLRSHRTDSELSFAPRYPALPWEWDASAVNVEMPAAVITTDELRPDARPDYNAVYISGQAGGVLGHVRRLGTAGDLLAPQVTDSLITHADAALQRGRAVLGAGGKKLIQTVTMPLLTGGSNPGLVQPGYLVQVNDINEVWRGLVRGISVNAALPSVRQTISIERLSA
jgi:hypothetical protein